MSEKLFRQVGDVVTEYTPEEYEQHYNDLEEQRLKKEAEEKAKAEAEEKKAIAEAKLEALGLTADDLKALGLG